jgi:hypothetical protein
VFYFDVDGRHIRRKDRCFQEGEVMSSVGNGCILEKDISNIDKLSMRDWNIRWVEGQRFTFFRV